MFGLPMAASTCAFVIPIAIFERSDVAGDEVAGAALAAFVAGVAAVSDATWGTSARAGAFWADGAVVVAGGVRW